MENVERTTKGPGKKELTVMSHITISSNPVRARQNLVGNILPAVWPKEMQPSAMQGFVDLHMSSRRGCMCTMLFVALDVLTMVYERKE